MENYTVTTFKNGKVLLAPHKLLLGSSVSRTYSILISWAIEFYYFTGTT